MASLDPWLAFTPLVGFVLFGLWRLPARIQAGLRAATAQERAAPLDLPAAPVAVARGRSLRDLVRRLGSRRLIAGKQLDPERSIRATLANGGLFTPKMRRASRAIEYVFLVSRRRRHDHERDRVVRLIELLRRGGAPLTVFDYDPDPRRLWPQGRGANEATSARRASAPIDLRGVAESYPDADLVLVTDGEDLIDFVTRRPRPFVRRRLASWPRKMILSPTPVAEWGAREMRLSTELGGLIGRDTFEGFEDLVTGLRPGDERPLHSRALDRARAPALRGASARVEAWLDYLRDRIALDFMPARPLAFALDSPALMSEFAAGENERKACVDNLRRWLGPHGFFWFAACAYYPQLRFNITLHLGQLRPPPPAPPLRQRRRRPLVRRRRCKRWGDPWTRRRRLTPSSRPTPHNRLRLRMMPGAKQRT